MGENVFLKCMFSRCDSDLRITFPDGVVVRKFSNVMAHLKKDHPEVLTFEDRAAMVAADASAGDKKRKVAFEPAGPALDLTEYRYKWTKLVVLGCFLVAIGQPGHVLFLQRGGAADD